MREALVTSAMRSAQFAEALGPARRPHHPRVQGVSNVQDLIAVYTELAARCDYPLHLGLTEAGMGSKGIVASTAALAVLLQQGIGDTIRISLTPEPNGDRTREVIVAQEILQTMGLRSFTPMVSACPGCGRTTSDVLPGARRQDPDLAARADAGCGATHYPGVENMTVAVMGCVVNGPGESKMANIGISLPGTGEVPVAPVYVDGQKTVTLKGDRIAEEFAQIIVDYVRATYGGETPAPHLLPKKKTIPIRSTLACAALLRVASGRGQRHPLRRRQAQAVLDDRRQDAPAALDRAPGGRPAAHADLRRAVATRRRGSRPASMPRDDVVAAALRRRHACADGGATRCGLIEDAAPDDWIVVHDAVRPCVDADALARLVSEARRRQRRRLACRARGSDAQARRRARPQRAHRAARRHLARADAADVPLRACCARRSRVPASSTSPTKRRRSRRWACIRASCVGSRANVKVTYPDDLAARQRQFSPRSRGGDSPTARGDVLPRNASDADRARLRRRRSGASYLQSARRPQ